MPAEGIDFAERSDLLTYEEIIRLATIFKSLGICKVRLTGGEPFVRKDMDQLLGSLVQLFPRVHVTTNATKIDAAHIAQLGVAGLNISLDSLDIHKFHVITRRDVGATVLANIQSCLRQKIPIKINMVVMKGINDNEIIDFIQYGIEHSIPVRFIEAMPFNDGDGNRDVYLSADEILGRIANVYDVHKLASTEPSAANHYQTDDYSFDVIPAYSRSLCGTCNRIRLTPQGELLNCLYSQSGTDLRALLRDGSNDQQIINAILQNTAEKMKDGHAAEKEIPSDNQALRSMTTIGG